MNYVKWSPDFNVFCGDPDRGIRSYCHPRFFDGTPIRCITTKAMEDFGMFRSKRESPPTSAKAWPQW